MTIYVVLLHKKHIKIKKINLKIIIIGANSDEEKCSTEDSASTQGGGVFIAVKENYDVV